MTLTVGQMRVIPNSKINYFKNKLGPLWSRNTFISKARFRTGAIFVHYLIAFSGSDSISGDFLYPTIEANWKEYTFTNNT